MTTKKVNTSMCITKKNARRSQVWNRFLEERKAGNAPVLMDCSDGFSYVAVPAKVQPKRGKDLRFLESARADFEGEPKGGPAFIGGWVGYLSYDFCAGISGVKVKKTLKIPEMKFVWCDKVYAFKVAKEDGAEFCAGKPDEGGLRGVSQGFKIKNFKSGISKAEYKKSFKKIQKALRDGETYQVNFAQELSGKFEGDPFALYTALYAKNPSAMCFYMEGEGDKRDGDWAICSNSPERLFSLRREVQGREAVQILRAEPVKGTVGADEDPKFLLKDKKSYAELTMIVDLMRNDLAQVSEIGSVKVRKHQALMKLKNVWHTYSIIESQLMAGKTIADVLLALVPGGSVTGCPKKRTISIIDSLENFSRGAYCGSAGYVSINGNADFNIMIRTATIVGARDGVRFDGRVSFATGGGIVSDSTCEGEYEETEKKAEVIRGVIG